MLCLKQSIFFVLNYFTNPPKSYTIEYYGGSMHNMRKGDIALITVAVISLVLWLIPKPQGGRVIISVNGEVYREVSLDENSVIPIETEFGKNTVVIEKGGVSVTHSNCPDGLCEKDRISKSGESIVCLPNRLSVTVEGKNKKEVDVILW